MKALISQFLKKYQASEHKPQSDAVMTELPLNSLRDKSKWLMSTVIFLLLLSNIFLLHAQSSTLLNFSANETVQTQTILKQLDAVNEQLQQLSSSGQNSTEFKQSLITMQADLSFLEKSVNNFAKASDVQKISDQLTSLQNSLTAQMTELKQAVANNSKDYLDPDVLPFHVISIDVIAQQPFASIDYDHHITPLTVGDSLAGWQITSADYAAGTVEFKNDRNQYVKVTLQG